RDEYGFLGWGAMLDGIAVRAEGAGAGRGDSLDGWAGYGRAFFDHDRLPSCVSGDQRPARGFSGRNVLACLAGAAGCDAGVLCVADRMGEEAVFEGVCAGGAEKF